MTRFRAAWATQDAHGCAVAPSTRIRRMWCSITASTNIRVPDRVTASKKSQAKRASAWERRKSAQVVDERSGAGSIPPPHILECRALLETYHDLRRAHTAWVQRIHAVFFHQDAPPLGEGVLRTEPGLEALRAAAAAHLSLAGQQQVATALA